MSEPNEPILAQCTHCGVVLYCQGSHRDHDWLPDCRERNHAGLDLLFDWDPLTGSTEGMGQDVAMLALKIRRLAKERADLELQMARELLAEVKALRSRVDPKEPA